MSILSFCSQSYPADSIKKAIVAPFFPLAGGSANYPQGAKIGNAYKLCDLLIITFIPVGVIPCPYF